MKEKASLRRSEAKIVQTENQGRLNLACPGFGPTYMFGCHTGGPSVGIAFPLWYWYFTPTQRE